MNVFDRDSGARLVTELTGDDAAVDRIGYRTGIVEAYPAAALASTARATR